MSEASRHARQFVDEHLPQARGLGQSLAELIDDPESFVAALREGLQALSDEPYAAEQERVAPGSGQVIGVRWPLIHAVEGQLRGPLKQSSAASALWLAQRLAVEPERELRLFARLPLERSLPSDPERSWQIIRRLVGSATDWISVDALAGLLAQGLLLEPFRWAELEQLVYSASRWERRTVGSTLANLPHQLPRTQRADLRKTQGLMLVKLLLGDDEPDVQKALSWALRSWHEADPAGVERLLSEEAALAAENDDGHRAWVVRDTLSLPAMRPELAAEIRAKLGSVRRRPGVPATSQAAAVARAFAGGGQLHGMSEQALAMQGERQRLAGRRA